MTLTLAVLAVAVAIGVALLARRTGAVRPANPGPSADAERPQAGDGIDAFWLWWKEAGPMLAAKIDAGRAAEIASEVSRHVDALHPGLAWETGEGLKGGRHHLALSSEGDVTLRVLTERWLARAPPPDGIWEFYPAKQAWGTRAIVYPDDPGVKIDREDTRVAAEQVDLRERIDVKLYHPAFAMLDRRLRLQSAFLLLDGVLGEDGVERWIGAIEVLDAPPAGGIGLMELRDRVERLSKAATGDRWAVLRSEDPSGRPTFYSVNLALKRIDHLLMEQLLTVTFPLEAPTELGLTTEAEAERLNALEDRLLAGLGHDAVFIGRETGQGKRTLHLHVAAAGPAEQRTLEWARGVSAYQVAIESRPDLTWEILKRF